MAEKKPPKKIHFSTNCSNCLRAAEETAISMGHTTLDTGHILLSLCKSISEAYIILDSLSIQEYDVRKTYEKLRPRIGQSIDKAEYDEEVQKSIKSAEKFCRQEGRDLISSRHLLAGIMSVEGSMAAQVIKQLGNDPYQVTSEAVYHRKSL